MKYPWLFFFILTFFPLFSDDIQVPPGDYSINIPVGWTINDRQDISDLSFISDDGSAIMQISYFTGDQFSHTDDMYQSLLSELNPQGDVSQFHYLQWQAWMADLQFNLSDTPYRGWFLLLNGEHMDYMVMVFTPLDFYEDNFPWMISALDAFSPGEASNRNPGPVSTLMAQGETGIAQSFYTINNETNSFTYPVFQKQISQELIEREAVLLSQYSVNEPLFRLAWDRYYNLIYRQSYSLLEDLYISLEPIYQSSSEEEFITDLLSWIQSFDYSSSNTFSDLLNPMTAAVEKRGDCDSLSLLYSMILEYFSISTIFIVSEEYSHAMAAVQCNLPGATIPYNDTNFIVAEMTDQVEIGQIASSMADIDKWQIISFEP